ncbi:MAG: alpha/beta hydrolase [Sphingomonadaceae bacterium]
MSDSGQFGPWVSAEARAAFAAGEPQPPSQDIAALRLHYDAFNRRQLAVAQELYPVDVSEEIWDGVPVHVVVPAGGPRDPRTLVCLHGGAFMWGAGAGALLEAVPVAAASGMRAIAVDYRLAPEHPFPAAVEDVLAVFARLNARQPAASIGLYGCSAGGMLTAQVTARLAAEKAQLPGAIAMLHGAGLTMAGDSATTWSAFSPEGTASAGPHVEDFPYFAGADLGSALVLPGNHPDVLAQFPPSLLVTASRDFAASSVSVMHRRLLAAGRTALFVDFDGLGHAHHMLTDLPESRETFALMARFFGEHLA